MKARFAIWAVLAMLMIPGAALADTVTFDLSLGSMGYLGAPTVTVHNGSHAITVEGFWLHRSWQPASLYRRHSANDHGFGICNPIEWRTTHCKNGDTNELDNMGQNEVIEALLPHNARWVSIQVSSLDTNGGRRNPPERGCVIASNNLNPNLAPITNCSSAVIFYTGGINPIEGTFAVPGAHASDHALYFIANDWLHHTNHNNDYLLYKLTIRVPEPATLGLLGIGLAALALKKRKS